MSSAGSAVVARLLGLVHGLRTAGVPVSMVEVLDGAAALEHIGLEQRHLVRAALGATLVKRPEDGPVFDAVFERYFPLTRAAGRPGDGSGRGAGDVLAALQSGDDDLRAIVAGAVDAHAGIADVVATERYYLHRVLRALDVAGLLAAAMRAERESASADATPFELRLRRDEHAERIEALRRSLAAEIRSRLGADAVGIPHRLDDVDLLRASTTDLRELRRAVRPLARKLAARMADRRRHRRRGRLDMRRTLRHSLASGGVPLEPAYRHRRATKPAVVVLCDVSGSMAEFAHFTLSLLHALHDELAGLRSFVFVDGIAEVTDVIERSDDVLEPAHLLLRPGVVLADGHSDYGQAIGRFWTMHGGIITPATTVLVAGDARSNYRPSGEQAFRLLCSRARRTYWLNPEPREEWGSDDSCMPELGRWCTAVHEVRTLRQLGDVIAELA
jgi:uncharacterized protein with von Willebrand factor type A (vWA) domain